MNQSIHEQIIGTLYVNDKRAYIVADTAKFYNLTPGQWIDVYNKPTDQWLRVTVRQAMDCKYENGCHVLQGKTAKFEIN
ncbi:UNVERIFIED_ORG: hypothetical protein ABRZ91_001791 [Heyndrickxia coagulans]